MPEGRYGLLRVDPATISLALDALLKRSTLLHRLFHHFESGLYSTLHWKAGALPLPISHHAWIILYLNWYYLHNRPSTPRLLLNYWNRMPTEEMNSSHCKACQCRWIHPHSSFLHRLAFQTGRRAFHSHAFYCCAIILHKILHLEIEIFPSPIDTRRLWTLRIGCLAWILRQSSVLKGWWECDARISWIWCFQRNHSCGYHCVEVGFRWLFGVGWWTVLFRRRRGGVVAVVFLYLYW